MQNLNATQIELFGEDYDLKLNAGSLRLAQMKDKGIDPGAMKEMEDFDLGMRLAYIALLPSLAEGRTEEEVVRELIGSGRANEIAELCLGEYLEMQNELGKYLEGRAEEMMSEEE